MFSIIFEVANQTPCLNFAFSYLDELLIHIMSSSMEYDQDCITSSPETDTSQPIKGQDGLNNTELQQGSPGVQVELETFEYERDEGTFEADDSHVETNWTTVSQDTVEPDSVPDPGLEHYSSNGPNADNRQESVAEATVPNRHTQSTEDLESTEQQDPSLSLSPNLQQESGVAGIGSYHGEPSSSLTSLSTSQNRRHSDCSTSLTASATPLTISEQEVDIESGGRISSYLLVSSEGMPDLTKFESPGLLYARGSKERHNRFVYCRPFTIMM